MTVEVEKTGVAFGFLDPECLCSTTLNSTDNTLAFSVSYMCNAFKLYAKNNFMFTVYHGMNHRIAVAIVLKQWKVYVDSRLSYQSSYGFASRQIPRRSQGTLLPSSGEPKVSNSWNNVQRKDSI
jgi:hypothetical protein